MIKQPFKVLSIDFDYFQCVSPSVIVNNYPDGHDLSTKVSTFVWQSLYGNKSDHDNLLDVTINKEELQLAKHIILGQKNPYTPCYVCNSHVNIYNAIKTTFEAVQGTLGKDGFSSIHIYNVDMHHDMFNDNPKLDCGNWVSHVAKDFPNVGITWIANPISKEMYGFDETDKPAFDLIENSLKKYKDMQFDLVFLCRSDIWSAPHLDKYFNHLFKNCQKTFDSGNLFFSEDITNPREIDFETIFNF